MPTPLPPIPAPARNVADRERWNREYDEYLAALIAGLPTLADYQADPARPMPIPGDRRLVGMPLTFVERLVRTCLAAGYSSDLPLVHTGWTSGHWGTTSGPLPTYRLPDPHGVGQSGWSFALGDLPEQIAMSRLGHVYRVTPTECVRIDDQDEER